MTNTLFQTVEIHGRQYTIQSVEYLPGGAQEWTISRKGTGSMYSVEVATDGTFGTVKFLY